MGSPFVSVVMSVSMAKPSCQEPSKTFSARLIHTSRKEAGTDFTNTAVIGRQIFMIDPELLRSNLAEFGYLATESVVRTLITEEKGYVEPFLRLLGAKEISSFDASPYEGAMHVHDFSIPIDYAFHQRFTSVIDSGTLEHVLNYPVALKHCVELVSLGGHFLAIMLANNFFGHGFYQFSPDLFYRVFTPENGFGIQQMWLLKRTASSGSRFPTRQTCAIGSLS